MESAARPGLKHRALAALALFVPCATGLLYLFQFGAPSAYLIVNSGALGAGLLWVAFGRLPTEGKASRILMFAFVVLLGLPLVIGPQVDGIARWLSFGGFSLHVGMTVIPLIAVMSARDEKLGGVAQLSAMLLALLQPDPASALAIMLAASGAAIVHRRPYAAVYALFALLTLGAVALLANLPPQEYVERIIPELYGTSPLFAALLSLSLGLSIALILITPGFDKPSRIALAGVVLGFTLGSVFGDYPTPLIGYGAAAIIGFSLALSHQGGIAAN